MPTQNFRERLEKLNENQRTAVETTEGPVMVVAGPGTGKTETLGARITNILKKNTDLHGGNILCLTYTEAGTVAMRKRLLSFLGPEAHKVAIHTFHGFANTVLQENSDLFHITSAENISELEQFELLESLLQELPANDPHFQKVGYSNAKGLLKFFALCKQEDWSSQDIIEACNTFIADLPNNEEFQYKRKYTNKKTGEIFQKGDVNTSKIQAEKQKKEKIISAAQLFESYSQKMKDQGKYDFADMILWVLEGFKTNEALLAQYQERYLYLLVDEFQDTNGSQKEMLDLLTGFWDDPNIFVVGDDDQSIYRFQGANMRNIMDFYHQYPSQITTITLDKNYRSSQKILHFADKIISKNTERLTQEIPDLNKNLTAMKQSQEIDISVRSYHNPLHEDLGIVRRIEALQKRGTPLSDIAIIYKNHSQAQTLIKLCQQSNIPIKIKQIQNILHLPIIKNIYTLLQYCESEQKNPYSGEHLLFSCLFHPWSGFSSTDISHIALQRKQSESIQYFKELLVRFTVEPQIIPSCSQGAIQFTQNLLELESLFHQLPFITFVETVLQKLGVLDWVIAQPNKGELLSAVSTFFHFIQDECKKNPSFSLSDLNSILKRMEYYGIALPIHKIQNEGDGVNFITAHSSKGLEFEYVFIKSITKQSWDYKKSDGYIPPEPLVPQNNGDHFEEIRRLFFVACTRAKEFLEISYPVHKESGEELQPSLLISETEEHIPSQSVCYSDEEINEVIENVLLPPPLQGEQLEQEFLSSLLAGYTLSPTHLNKYLQCPKRFYYEALLRIPQAMNAHAIFGNSVHAGLETTINELKKNPDLNISSLQTIAQQSAEKVLSENKFALEKPEYIKLKKQLTQVLNVYFEKGFKPPKNIAKCHTEYSITTGIGTDTNSIPIKGKLDKIEEISTGRVTVTDYKTGNATSSFTKAKLKSPDASNQFLGGEYWRQMMFYALLIENNPKGKQMMCEGIFDFVEPQNGECTKHKISIDEEGKKRIEEIITSAYRAIQSGEFTGCGEESCEWCGRQS